jgi:hypothetical protein
MRAREIWIGIALFVAGAIVGLFGGYKIEQHRVKNEASAARHATPAAGTGKNAAAKKGLALQGSVSSGQGAHFTVKPPNGAAVTVTLGKKGAVYTATAGGVANLKVGSKVVLYKLASTNAAGAKTTGMIIMPAGSKMLASTVKAITAGSSIQLTTPLSRPYSVAIDDVTVSTAAPGSTSAITTGSKVIVRGLKTASGGVATLVIVLA